MPRRPWACLLALLLTTSCSGVTSGEGSVEGAASAPAVDSCPVEAVQPPADRPVVDLRFELDGDGRTVTGTEQLRFTPDLPTDELVFRLTANQPQSVTNGSRIAVGDVTGEDVDDVAFERAGADESTQGGLLAVRLRGMLQPGESTDVEIDFELLLGTGAFDRFGHDGQLSWWGSGHPLLAWEPGQGWRREPLLDRLGETSTSPAARTTLTVVAPAGRTVLMTGGAVEGEDDGEQASWRSSSTAARDVSVAVGNVTTAERLVGDTRLVVGADTADTAGELLGQISDAVVALEQYLGPFPFDTLSVARLQDYGGGIEYPAMILLADDGEVTVTHEVAHMWFYGMVGGDQARDPWLDESFATYAEGLVTGTSEERESALQLPLDVGLGIGEFPDTDAYFDTVYGKGGAMLHLARSESGTQRFDAALRCYLNANAWQVAVPADVRTALQELPAALAVLQEAGAL